jgi:ABC-type iron transport system FetAB ATPase subunit
MRGGGTIWPLESLPQDQKREHPLVRSNAANVGECLQCWAKIQFDWAAVWIAHKNDNSHQAKRVIDFDGSFEMCTSLVR